VAGRIESLVEHGFRLGERGAYFSAREELLEAVRLVAQSLDAEAGGQRHALALARGMKALAEAEDFQMAGERLDAEYNAADLARGHKTPVLKEGAVSPASPLEAMQVYYAYAEGQLAEAASSETVASRAWYALAKLQPFLVGQDTAGMVPAPRALVLHRVALRIDGQNYLAQNELAVLLARYGRYEDARQLLERSAQTCPLPAAWQNLAVVYRELGWADRSQHAEQQARQLAGQPVDESTLLVRLVEPDRFRSTPTQSEGFSEVARAPQPSTVRPGTKR